MAKKNPIASTLKKKVPLNKSKVDLEAVKETVEQIHHKPEQKNKVKEKVMRISVDTPEGLYKDIKVHCAIEGIALKDYILSLVHNDLKKKGLLKNSLK